MTCRPTHNQTAYELALQLLARRDLSTSQLRDRLQKSQLSSNDIACTISRLIENRALDDSRTAIAYARRSATVKLRGKHRTQQELHARGFPLSVASYAVATVFSEVNETTVLERAIQKRLNGPVRTRTQFRKLYQALLRQGFPSEAIACALVSRTESGDSFMEEYLDDVQ